MTSLSIASYNIHKARGLDRRTDLARIAAVLEEIDADLVGVQEIYHHQLDELASRLGMRGLIGVTHLRAEGPYGNAIRRANCCLDAWWPEPAQDGTACTIGMTCPADLTCNE